MAPQQDKNKDPSRGTSKRTKTTKPKVPVVERGQQKPMTPTTLANIQRMREIAAMKALPSNAPTMDIAPSDFEHIYHQESNALNQARNLDGAPGSPPRGPSTKPHFTGPASPQDQGGRQAFDPISPPSPQQPQIQTISPNTVKFDVQFQVTPDGYQLLGQEYDQFRRHVALPPHIVRGCQDFSLAALARIANYLASRAERGD